MPCFFSVSHRPSGAAPGCAAARNATAPSATSSLRIACIGGSARQQFFDGGVDKGGIFGIECRVAGAMTPDRWDRAQFGTRHLRDLAAVILDRKIEIGLAWYDDRIGRDRAERFFEIAVIELIGADIGMLPSPQHREQIVGVAAAKIGLPATDEKILE